MLFLLMRFFLLHFFLYSFFYHGEKIYSLQRNTMWSSKPKALANFFPLQLLSDENKSGMSSSCGRSRKDYHLIILFPFQLLWWESRDEIIHRDARSKIQVKNVFYPFAEMKISANSLIKSYFHLMLEEQIMEKINEICFSSNQSVFLLSRKQ